MLTKEEIKMKKISFLLLGAVLVTLCSCSGTVTTQRFDENGYPILKWGIPYMEFEAEKGHIWVNIDEESLNNALHEKGYEFSVEVVYMEEVGSEDWELLTDYTQLVKSYEKENGSLDILTLGTTAKGGEGYDLITGGYFEPLDYQNAAFYDIFSEELWNTMKWNGTVYTVPRSGSLFNPQLVYYFNNEVIPEEEIENFDGTLEYAAKIAMSLPDDDELRKIDMGSVGTDFKCIYDYDYAQGLVLDYKTMQAANPFEYEPFVQWARTANEMYNAGCFSHYPYYDSHTPFDVMHAYPNVEDEGYEFVEKPGIVVCSITLRDFEWFNCTAEQMEEFAFTGYITSKTPASTGIAAGSGNKENALTLLELCCTDTDIIDAIGGKVVFNITEKEEVDDCIAQGIKISPYGGFMICCNQVKEYLEIGDRAKEMLYSLCMAEDFDAALAGIKAELDEMGIDGYIAAVNQMIADAGLR